jgi:hypothetical protein
MAEPLGFPKMEIQPTLPFQTVSMKGITYKEEVEEIRTRLLQSEKMQPFELKLLIHTTLMKDLAILATSKQLPFVDVIARLNQDRDVMVSWVHLSPRGKRRVAEAFTDEILKHTWNPRPTTHQEEENE